MKKCNLSKEINNCPFCNKEKMECNNENTQCTFREREIEGNKKYVRQDRWYEKYYKDSRPKKG